MYTIEHIERIAAKLRELPRIERKQRQINKREAVALLAKEIKLMQQRGYALEQIADALRREKLDMTTPALKAYLQHAKGQKKKVKNPVNKYESSPSSVTAPVANPPAIPDNSGSDTEGD